MNPEEFLHTPAWLGLRGLKLHFCSFFSTSDVIRVLIRLSKDDLFLVGHRMGFGKSWKLEKNFRLLSGTWVLSVVRNIITQFVQSVFSNLILFYMYAFSLCYYSIVLCLLTVNFGRASKHVCFSL